MKQTMLRIFLAVLIAGAVSCVSSRSAQAQTRADTAAVLVNAAEQLRLRGEAGAARALLDLVARQYAGTPAADDVARMRDLLRRTPDTERSGRTELMVFGATYGAWLGIAVPLIAESTSGTAYGLGLLLGAPTGFFAARQYANTAMPTEGQTRAVTFGGLWGTWQGFGWAEVLDVGQSEICNPPEFGGECYESDGDVSARLLAAVVGGLGGIGTGVMLARKPITAGTAAAVSLSGFWGTWFGWGLAYLGGVQDEALLTSALIGGNAALVATGLTAPGWEMSESRARLISVGGLIGALGGAGVMLIMSPDNEKLALAGPLLASAAGLALAASHTRERDLAPGPDGDGGAGALLNLRDGRWALDMPSPGVRMHRTDAGMRPAAWVPLLHARF